MLIARILILPVAFCFYFLFAFPLTWYFQDYLLLAFVLDVGVARFTIGTGLGAASCFGLRPSEQTAPAISTHADEQGA